MYENHLDLIFSQANMQINIVWVRIITIKITGWDILVYKILIDAIKIKICLISRFNLRKILALEVKYGNLSILMFL